MHIVTKDRIHYLLLCDPNEQLTLKIPPNWNPDSFSFSIAPGRDRILVEHEDQEGGVQPSDYKLREPWREKYWYIPHTEWVELYEVDRTGKLELVNRFEWVNPGQEKTVSPWDKIESRRKRAACYVAALAPPIFNLAWEAHYRQVVADRGRSRGINESAIILFINPWRDVHLTSTPLNLALSLLMVAAAFAHGWARRTSWAKFIFWLVFVGLFNLAALLTYLALNHTAVIKCPACGKRRGLQRLDCARCGAELALPQPRKVDLILQAG
jgi:DNA-directed RNA polymerase subunit RPC12/RpoP